MKKQKRKQAQAETEETYEELIIQIINRRCSKAIIIQFSSDEEEDPITIKFSDDEVLGAAEEAEIKIKIKKTQISVSGRPQRNASARKLPQRLRD